MKTKEIEKLIKILENHKLTEITYKDNDMEISLKKEVPSVIAGIPSHTTSVETKQDTAVNAIKSPLVGVYYAKPSPDAQAFIAPGQHVSKGDTLCIIEAMKVMNEIKNDRSGIVKEIAVIDGDAVSFDQVLVVFEA